ncbi:MAG: pyridoxal phosphate-dependent aminotransferase [Saprospiraceae bacterium]|nr:pyridoxal phosphate-dependent aminotransferase [Saprospiraceae bacterium]
MVSKLPNVGTTIFTVMSALANKHGAINLSQGFPNYNPSDRLQQLVTDHMRAGDNQYAPMPGLPLLRERIAAKMQALYGANLDPEKEITVTSGGTQAIFTAIAAFVHPGDEVILIEPCYDSYRPSVELMGGIPVVYALEAPDFRVNWQQLGSLITPRTRMLIINTPNNPTGTLLRDADMVYLEALLKNTGVILLSDEVYEHLVYDGEQHASVLRYPGLYERSLCVYSFGKTYHNTGWKTGYCIGPEALMREFRKVHQFNVFSSVMPLQAAFADYMEDDSQYLGLPAFYQQKRDFFQKVIADSRFKILPCDGTYFQLCDYSAVSDEPERDFCERLTVEFGVAAIPVSAFYSDGRNQKLLRFCFAKTEELLLRAGEKLLAVSR